MCYADTVGLFAVEQAMRRFAKNKLTDQAFWEPARLIQRLAAEGRSFGSLDAEGPLAATRSAKPGTTPGASAKAAKPAKAAKAPKGANGKPRATA